MNDIRHVELWAKESRRIIWKMPWSKVCDGEMPFVKWFVGGQLNAVDTCVIQHALSKRADKIAICFENENGLLRQMTYAELYFEVQNMAAQLAGLGVEKGDKVAIYMPLIPEAVVAMLGCAFLGATHSVIFGGFAAQAVRERVIDAECKVVVTADGGIRKGAIVPLKATIDEALEDPQCMLVKHVVVVKYMHNSVNMKPGRDVYFESGRQVKVSPTEVDSEHPLFILYTSGTTGKPKGIVHSTGGYLTQVVSTAQRVFQFKEEDVYWCTADVGWITGHSYVVYGPLALGATVMLYDGALTHPQPGRFFEIIEKHGVTILYTAPTLVRMLMRFGDDIPSSYNLSSLRLLGSVGEPINPEAWRWYHRVIGGGRCDVVDTWWQTETGAMMISPIPGITKLLPGSATKPLPGVEAQIVRDDGTQVKMGEHGYLVLTQPWPSMARGIYKDNERFIKTYFSFHPGMYFTGDGARVDKEGNFTITGRIDDVVNVAGHRLGTAEIESALVLHPAVAEAAVVARPDDVTGQAIVAFVTIKDDVKSIEYLLGDISESVSRNIGAFAKPKNIYFTKVLPKTRSGKIMRRLLREFAEKGHASGDTTTLEDASWQTQLNAG